MRFIAFTLFAVSSVTSFAQHDYGSATHTSPTVDQPIRTWGSREFDPLQRITMHDYEVWIAKDTSKTVDYRLHIKTKTGWDVVGMASSDIHAQDRIFETSDEAMIYLDYFRATSKREVLDYYLEPIIYSMEWEYMATFDNTYEAHEFLDLLMEMFGDEYVGQIIKVRVPPRSLQ